MVFLKAFQIEGKFLKKVFLHEEVPEKQVLGTCRPFQVLSRAMKLSPLLESSREWGHIATSFVGGCAVQVIGCCVAPLLF